MSPANTNSVIERALVGQADLDRIRRDQTGVCWWCGGVAASIDTRQALFDARGVRRGCTSAETAKTSTLYEAGAVMP
jgi:hypothetical protein